MVSVIGWTVAILGIAMPVPQFVRLVRERTSAGLSLLAWQIWLAAGISWSVHGILNRDLVVLLPNFLGGIIALLIVLLIRRNRILGWWPVLRITLLVCAIAIGLRVGVGPAAFGSFMAIPQAIGCLGQLGDVIEKPDLSGVSVTYLALTAFCQVLWVSFGALKPDISVLITGCVMLVMSGLTLVWYLLRRSGAVGPKPLLRRVRPAGRVD